jgi:gamma-glutamylcyclotransferase (GGCT)/AIG2-like uncharacterized protein YtfP
MSVAEENQAETVFVYGTLLSGLHRNEALKSAIYGGPAMVEGQLHDLGDYPAIQQGLGDVMGELYSVSRELLRQLDRIEGYYAGDESDSLFVRKVVTARRLSDGSYVEVCCYFFNSYIDNRVSHGDYRRYLIEQSNSERWLVAYGSNMSLSRITQRVGKVKAIAKGSVENFRLAFNKRAVSGVETFANLIFTGGDESCPVAAYRLTEEQIEQLDIYEGTPQHYRRSTVWFTPEVGESVLAEIYLACPDALVINTPPRKSYVQHLLDGYDDHGINPLYLHRVLASDYTSS